MLGKRKKVADSGGDTQVVNNTKPKKKRGKKKKIAIGAIVLVVIIAIIVIPRALSGGEAPLQVTTGIAEKMDVEQVVSIKGTIQGSESADVVSSLNYEITKILVEEGDLVKKDQVLAHMDIEDLEDDYKKAATALQQSKFTYEASKTLFDEGAISKEEFLRAESAYKNDQTSLNSFNLGDKSTIKSPIAGTITRVNTTIGRYARDTENNLPMFVVEDLDNLKMDVRISEYDISKIKPGQKVTITADVIGKGSVEGLVSRISPTGEAKDVTSKEMVIPVQIDVLKGDVNLIAGVTAKAKILIEKRENVLSVPIDSILEDPDTSDNYVFILKEGLLKKVAVDLGIEGDFYVEILSGNLSENDSVVLSPTFEMEDGMAVSTLPQM